MCGLAGVMGEGVTPLDMKIFRELMMIQSPRGFHSTGFFILDKNGSQAIRKEVCSPGHLMEYYSYGMLSNPARIVMGHNRWATQGKITKENAHPYDTGRYVSAHNGTIHKFWARGQTDSEAMFNVMEARGIENSLNQLRYDESYAVTIYDKREKLLHFARNDCRPLVFGLHKKRDVLYWASEKRFLIAALEVQYGESENVNFFNLPAFEIRSVSTDDLTMSLMTDVKLDKKLPKKRKDEIDYEEIFAQSEILKRQGAPF